MRLPIVFAVPARAALALVTLLGAAPALAEGEEERKTGWSNSAELSVVATGGNAEAETLGFQTTLLRRWKRTDLRIEAGGLRAETTTTTRTAIGSSPGQFEVVEDSRSELTAENYHLDGRWDRRLSERFFWFVGAGWERNRFAGIESRSYLSAGAGNLWIDIDTAHFSTTYGLTYTRQNDVVAGPRGDDSFPGVRFTWEYWRQLTGTTRYGNDLIVNANLDETSDYRGDMTNWLSVKMSDRLALRVSLQLLYDNQPALASLRLLTADGVDTGETVTVELDTLDSVLTVGLLVSF